MDGVGRVRSFAESLLPRRGGSFHNNGGLNNGDQTPPTFNNLFFQKITNKMDSIMKNCQKVRFFQKKNFFCLSRDIYIHVKVISHFLSRCGCIMSCDIRVSYCAITYFISGHYNVDVP